MWSSRSAAAPACSAAAISDVNRLLSPEQTGQRWIDRRHGSPTLGQRVHRLLAQMPKPKPPIDPALLKHEQERAEARQNRLADRITTFAGSMLFVYLHIIWFGCWIGFGSRATPTGC